MCICTYVYTYICTLTHTYIYVYIYIFFYLRFTMYSSLEQQIKSKDASAVFGALHVRWDVFC